MFPSSFTLACLFFFVFVAVVFPCTGFVLFPPSFRQCSFGFLDLDETRSEGSWLSYSKVEEKEEAVRGAEKGVPNNS